MTYFAYAIEVSESDNWLNENIFLASLLLMVVLAMGSLTYYQEVEATQLMASFNVLVPHHSLVLRNGLKDTVPAADVVTGDIIYVEAGDQIPCDLYIIESNAFKVDNSSLTGESEPQTRSPGFSNDNPFETKNLAFLSTYAIEGSCCGIAIRTGDNTAIGKVAHLTSTVKGVQKPIAKDLAIFVRVLCIISITVGILCFVFARIYHFPWVESLLLMISLFVGSVPDGLMPSVVVSLMLAAKRLAKKQVVVKNIESVETLGSTTVICSDKTGTLTQNRMTVGHLWFDNTVFKTNTEADQTGREPSDYDVMCESFNLLMQVAVLCSRAEFKPNQEFKPVMLRDAQGDASESALLKFATLKFPKEINSFRLIYKKVCEIPFSSVRKYQVSIHEFPNSKTYNYILVMKGAPESVIELCSTIYVKEKEMRIDNDTKSLYNEACHQFASTGERVLAFCHYYLSSEIYPKGFKFDADKVNFNLTNLCLLGLISMVDPPRPNVLESVLKCRTAGIKVYSLGNCCKWL
uniref:P-type ATPase A domain-containing protein n=1 Tax=Strigamia maritima TaxID=126957 RepID=T1IXJ6_STRMM